MRPVIVGCDWTRVGNRQRGWVALEDAVVNMMEHPGRKYETGGETEVAVTSRGRRGHRLFCVAQPGCAAAPPTPSGRNRIGGVSST